MSIPPTVNPQEPKQAPVDAPMLTSMFDYELPPELVPDRPQRGKSRLMHLPPITQSDSGKSPTATSGGKVHAEHYRFDELPKLLRRGDLLVFNDTRVLKARLRGQRKIIPAAGTGSPQGGGAVEALLVEPNGGEHPTASAESAPRSRWLAMLRPGKRQRPGQELVLGGLNATVGVRRGDLFELCFEANDDAVLRALESVGELPLPPYLGRTADERDNRDYQTVFADKPGAVAAPTAGLHFHQSLLEDLSAHGVATTNITLHVGPGTFRPVAADDARQHEMDSERYEIPESAIDAIQQTKGRGGRVIAVGTTVTRTLEGAFPEEEIPQGSGFLSGRTDLFIVPGYRFRIIDGLITNFHLPRSTLLMLVAALIGRERLLAAYQIAITEGYRFYSYGDAMLTWNESR